MMESLWNQFTQVMGGRLPDLLSALAILIIGWLIALILAAVIRTALKRTGVARKLAGWVADERAVTQAEPERWIAKGVYYLVMLFVLVAFFQVLGLTLITEPLNRILVRVFEFAPRILSASLLLLLAWILASVLKFIVSRLLTMTKVDERLGEPSGLKAPDRPLISKTIADAVYWLVFLVFLPAVLDALAVESLLLPMQAMLTKVLSFLPNPFAGSLILLVGWFAARIVQGILTNLLAATGIDRIGERAGLGSVLGDQRLSGLIGLVAYILILIPTAIAALDALQFAAISGPASQMLTAFLNAIPGIFAAALVLLVAYLVGRVVAGLASELLSRVGFDTILSRLGIGGAPAQGQRTPSEVAGFLVLVAILLFAVIEAAQVMGFALLAQLLAEFITFAGRVILGLVVFGVGLYLANLAASVIQERSPEHGWLLAVAARGALLVLAGAMALRQMGLANEIITTAFGLVLGAIAIAVALAFGLGSREVAGREVERWVRSVKGSESSKR